MKRRDFLKFLGISAATAPAAAKAAFSEVGEVAHAEKIAEILPVDPEADKRIEEWLAKKHEAQLSRTITTRAQAEKLARGVAEQKLAELRQELERLTEAAEMAKHSTRDFEEALLDAYDQGFLARADVREFYYNNPDRTPPKGHPAFDGHPDWTFTKTPRTEGRQVPSTAIARADSTTIACADATLGSFRVRINGRDIHAQDWEIHWGPVDQPNQPWTLKFTTYVDSLFGSFISKNPTEVEVWDGKTRYTGRGEVTGHEVLAGGMDEDLKSLITIRGDKPLVAQFAGPGAIL